MAVTDAQVRRLRQELAMGRPIGEAAMKAAMSRNTATKHASGPLPSERRVERSWRTRKDPFEVDWPEIEQRLREAPELEAKAIFEELIARFPERYEAGQLRTLQRRVRRWSLGERSKAASWER